MKSLRIMFILTAMLSFCTLYGQSFQSVKNYLTPQIDSCISVIDQSKSRIGTLEQYLLTKPKHRPSVKRELSHLRNKLSTAQKSLKKLFDILPPEQYISIYVTIQKDTVISPDQESVEELLRNSNFTTILPLTPPITLSAQGTYYRIQLCTLSSEGNYDPKMFSQFPDHLVVQMPPYTVVFSKMYSTYEQAVKELPDAREFYHKDAFITKWQAGSIVHRFYQ